MTEIDNKSGERGTVHQKVRVKNLTFGGQFFFFFKKRTCVLYDSVLQ